MTFDFLEKFKHYQNIDLLRIIHQPENYQQAAIDAATELLKERQVTEEELELAKNIDEAAKKRGPGKLHVLATGESADMLEDVLQPDEKARKWFRILIVILALLDVWTLFIKGRYFMNIVHFIMECRDNGYRSGGRSATIFSCLDSVLNIQMMLALSGIIYTPVIFYLVYKKRKWGWILLFADNMFTVVSLLGSWYFYLKYQGAFKESFLLTLFLPTAARAAFLYFLGRNEFTDSFPLGEETRKKTLAASAFVSFSFIGLLILFS